MERTVEKRGEESGRRPAAKGRPGKLFRVLVLGGVAIAVACASVPRGPTGVPDDGPSDGGGTPGW